MNSRTRKVVHASGVAMALAVLTVTTAAMAFSRDLSGAWTLPGGEGVLIVHNPNSGAATFTMPASLPSMGINRLQFCANVFGTKGLDGDSSANDFVFAGDMEPVSFGAKSATCTTEGTIGGVGTVLGQIPNRKLRMECRMRLNIKCEDGTKKKTDLDCSGDWR